MTTQRVWPGLDMNGVSFVVYAEDGVTLIPAAGGADVTLVQEVSGGPYVLPAYYRNLQFAGRLLTYDPLGLSGDPITVGSVTRVSAGLVGIVTTALATRAILSDGEMVTTIGYAEAGDGGGATWLGRLEVSAGENGFTKRNTTNGQWQLLPENGALNLIAAGVPSDGVTDASGVLNLLIEEAITGYGGVLDLGPPGQIDLEEIVFAIAAPIVASGDGNLWLRGYGGSCSVARTRVCLHWIGGDCGLDAVGDKKSMLVLNSPGIRISHVKFSCAPLSSLVSYIDTTANGASAHLVEDCDALSGNDLAGGLVDHFITSGYGASVGNSENFQFVRVFMRNFKRAAFCFVTGQPFGWEAHRCVVDNDIWFNASGELRGAALQGNGYGMAFKFCEFRSVASLVVGDSEVSIEGGSAERCKMLLYAVPAGGPRTQSVTRLRFNISEGAHLPATCLANNGTVYFSLGEYSSGPLYLINVAQLGQVKLVQNLFDGILSRYLVPGVPTPDFANNANLYMALTGTGLDASGDTFWNTQPISMGSYQTPPPGIWMKGCKGKDSATTEAFIPNRTGCANPGDSLAFANGVSSVPVVFDARLLEHHDARYVVCPIARVTAGTPAAGALRPYVTGQTSAGFTMRLEATPGSGGDATATVSVDYILVPR